MIPDIQQILELWCDRMEKITLLGNKEVLTMSEAAMLTGYKEKGLYELTSQRRIPHYKKNGKLYFKKAELVEWMTDNRVMTDEEINRKAITYVATHR